jgi:hypothetical protein
MSTPNATLQDKEALRKFYFSSGSSFGNFKTAHDRTSAVADKRAPTPMADPVATPGPMMTPHGHPRHADSSAVSMSHVSVAMPSPIHETNESAASPEEGSAVAKVGISALRSMQASRSGAANNTAKAKATKVAPPDAASAEYFEFLKRQQELQGHHNRLEDTVRGLSENRRGQQAALAKLRRQAIELLREVEESTDWKLRTKYDLQQLARDAGLSLQLVELVEDKAPEFSGIERLGAELSRIRAQYAESSSFNHHRLLVDQAIRRLSVLEKFLADGNNDSSEVSRIPDTLVVHLEKVSALAPIDSLVQAAEEAIERATFRVEEARKERAVAIDEGEVHVAEQLCYDVIDHHEVMLEHVINKAKVVGRAIDENAVLEEVRSKYHQQTYGEFDRITSRCTRLKARCDEDMKKMFALREKVESMEAQSAAKVVEERQKLDVVLIENTKKIDVVFAKMEELERELEVLEKERHRVVQQRIAAKDRDEHRRAEFAQFCATVDEHLVPLERTIRNMDVINHSVLIVSEIVHAGFQSLQEELADRGALLKDVKLETHKQHVEVFRGLLLELGEIVYKKERMIEETDKSIQQAHIQQELLAETFNPNAKKFGDVKKRLLSTRDDLEGDVHELKERASTALDGFRLSEDALEKANVDFVHPVSEQEQHTLALRARMVEFKAIANGHVEGQALLEEINALKREMQESRRDIEMTNQSTSGTVNRTLPLIRAAQKARQV